jgi:hypothetical protein
VEFDAYLAFNGSYCFDGSGVIFDNPISGDDVKRLIQNAAGIGRPVCIATKDRVAANGMDTDLADYYGFANMPPIVSPDFDAVAQQNIYQVMLGCRKSDYPAILEGVEGAKSWSEGEDTVRHVVIGPEAGERPQRRGYGNGGNRGGYNRGKGGKGNGNRGGYNRDRGPRRDNASHTVESNPAAQPTVKKEAEGLPLYGRIK